MAFQEFVCRSGGSNMNGGSLASNAEPSTSPVYSATNGGWNSGTGVFTPTSGNPSLSVTVGDYANVFTDGSTTPVFVGRVTDVSSTTITVSTSVKAGTAPTTAGTGISINVGGAWAGPSGAVRFPFNFAGSSLASSPTIVRVNFKNDQTYNISANMDHSVNGPTLFQGYTTTFGDKGKFVVDGGSPAGSSYILLSLSGSGVAHTAMGDFEFRNNGTGGSAAGLSNWGDSRCFLFRGVIHDIRGAGVSGVCNAAELEVYACNKSNTDNSGGIVCAASGTIIRCIAHHNTGTNNSGIYDQAGNANLFGCISFSNGKSGYWCINVGSVNLYHCDFYDNVGDGILLEGFSGNARYRIDSCNLVKNGGYGIRHSNTVASYGWIQSCGFGSGTQANTSGSTSSGSINGLFAHGLIQEGNITYSSDLTPWVDPVNGDFRINLAEAKGAGMGRYTETAIGYAGTVGYPDIGSAQSIVSAGSSPIAQLKTFGRGSPY